MYRGIQKGLFESTCLIIKRYILTILSVYADQYLTTYYSSFLRAISKSMLYNKVCFFSGHSSYQKKYLKVTMGWIQIFDQLVAFSESANEPILEALDHHFNFWTK